VGVDLSGEYLSLGATVRRTLTVSLMLSLVCSSSLLGQGSVCPLVVPDSSGQMPPDLTQPMIQLSQQFRAVRALFERPVPGEVHLELIVRCDGRADPQSLLILGASDSAAAIEVARLFQNARFSLGKRNGELVAVRMQQRFYYGNRRASSKNAPKTWWVPACTTGGCLPIPP
jgi:hypothetical protein